jgi:3-hydroxyisobutyrate dehydrogenase-like beta-hydroxyacid dehydrogenase
VTAPIGIVGLGLVGTAVAERLSGAGFEVLGFDVDPARRQPAHATASLAELSAACGDVVIAVYDETQAGEVIAALDGPRSVLCLTTCSPEGAEALAARAAERAMHFVEFPVSGTSAQLRAGEATGLLAGDPGRLGPLLDAICPRRAAFARTGDAARAKLAINLVLQVNRAALAEGIALAEGLGLDPSAFLAAARASAAYSAVMDTKGEKMVARDFRPQSRIAQTLKDAELIQEAARSARLPLPVHAAQAGLLREALSRLGPEVDSAAVLAALRPA